MYRLRKEDASVYLYLKDSCLSEFIEFQEKDSLNYSKVLSSGATKVYEIDTSMEPNPFGRGRGIVYFDDLTNEQLVASTTYSGTKEQSQRVILYDDTFSVLDSNDYIIDYTDGRVTTISGVIPSYIDYYWNYVSLVDEWSTALSAKPPVVVVDISSFHKTGFQLGGGRKTVRKGSLTIFASSAGERNDLSEVLYDKLYLKSCPYYDFPQGTVLDYDGTFRGRKTAVNKEDNLFLRTTVSGVSRLQFENVTMKSIVLPFAISIGNNDSRLSDLNAYRAKIEFDLISYSEE